MNGGRRSISTFSVTTKRLLRCLRGGLPTMGIVSLGPARRRLMVEVRGAVPLAWSRPRESLSWGMPEREVRWMGSWGASGLTTTMGGAWTGWVARAAGAAGGGGGVFLVEAGGGGGGCCCAAGNVAGGTGFFVSELLLLSWAL